MKIERRCYTATNRIRAFYVQLVSEIHNAWKRLWIPLSEGHCTHFSPNELWLDSEPTEVRKQLRGLCGDWLLLLHLLRHTSSSEAHLVRDCELVVSIPWHDTQTVRNGRTWKRSMSGIAEREWVQRAASKFEPEHEKWDLTAQRGLKLSSYSEQMRHKKEFEAYAP